jgi:hypothetical protein
MGSNTQRFGVGTKIGCCVMGTNSETFVVKTNTEYFWFFLLVSERSNFSSFPTLSPNRGCCRTGCTHVPFSQLFTSVKRRPTYLCKGQ